MSIATSQSDPWLRSVAAKLDREGDGHLYQQLAKVLRTQIESRLLSPGQVLPTQRELSRLWGIGEVTIRRALRDLASEGLIEARPGAGTVVRDPEDGSVSASGTDRLLTIGVAFADLADGYPFFRPILRGLREQTPGVAVRLFDLPEVGTADASSAVHRPALAGLDGMIMMTPINLGLLAACQERRLPTVLMFTDLSDGFSHCVGPDYTRGVVEAVMELSQRGRRRIALVTAGDERASTGRWVEAYRGAMLGAGLTAEPGMVVKADYSEGAAAEATRRLLALPQRPDAILFASDEMARGGLLAAHAAGLEVPGDLAVIGAGPILDEHGWTKPLTSIDLGLQEMGRCARRALVQTREGTLTGPLRTAVSSSLRLGQTH